MSKVKFKMDKKGIGELLKSKDMTNVLRVYANQVQGRAGDGYDVDTYVGFDRAHAVVYADTYKAKQDNAENNTLLKALGGGR